MTDGAQFDFSRSRAVLIGTARYDELPQVHAAANSLKLMRKLLTGPMCGWPSDRVEVILNKRKPGDLRDQLVQRYLDVKDVALFYYVGHGQADVDGHLCLGLVGSSKLPERRTTTSLAFDDVRRAFKASQAAIKIIILDCCFAGLAAAEGALGEVDVRAESNITGAHIVAACGPYSIARYDTDPENDKPFTYFTRHLVEVVKRGVPGGPEALPLNTVIEHLIRSLAVADLPIPHVRAYNYSGGFPFARNAAPPSPNADPDLPSLESPVAPDDTGAEPRPNLDDTLVAPVQYFLSNGSPEAAAHWLTERYPDTPDVVAYILTVVGSRTPGLAVDLLHAIAESSSSQSADALIALAKETDGPSMSATEAMLRSRPYPETPLPSPASDPLDVLAPDPETENAKRRAIKARQGAVVQVVGEILAEADVGLSKRGGLSFGYVPQRVLELIEGMLREVPVPELAAVTGTVLSEVVAAGRTDSASQFLRDAALDGDAELIRDVLRAMRRPELLHIFKELADRERKQARPGTLQTLVGYAPAPVAAEFLRHWYQTTGGVALSVSDLPDLGAILHNMVERDASTAAAVLVQDIDAHILKQLLAPKHDWAETKIASAVLDLARRDIKGSGRLLAVLLQRNKALLILLYMQDYPGIEDALGRTADVAECAIRCDPDRVAVYFALLWESDERVMPLLERVAQVNSDYGSKLVSALLATNAVRLKRALPQLIRDKSTTIPTEALRQMGKHDPSGLLAMAAQALQDRAVDVAIGILDSYFRPGTDS